MKQNENAILVLLTITTAVLTAMLLWTLSTTPEAMAGSASVSGGNYIMGAGAFSASRDLVYVINRPAARINVYALDINNKRVKRIATADLTKLFP